MNEQEFSFTLVDRLQPDAAIRNSLRVISESTKGYVTGNIGEYDGPIRSYVKKSGFSAIGGGIQNDGTVDIQKDLGGQNESDHKFEVYLSVKGMDRYKYRMMFINYQDVAYPVTIVMNEDLLAEYRNTYEYTFRLYSMKEVQEMMDKVLNSNTMKNLLQSLINEALRREQHG